MNLWTGEFLWSLNEKTGGLFWASDSLLLITFTLKWVKGIVHTKMKILSLITHPYVVQTHKTFIHLHTQIKIFLMKSESFLTLHRQQRNWNVQGRGLHGGPETRGPGTRPGTRTGSGLYFKWSAGSGSGPNLLPRVPGLFNIPESIGEHRTREWSVSVSMRVFCNLQFVKLGWEKCEREIRWKKKHALPQPPEAERARS